MYEKQRTGTSASRSHTSNDVPARLAERVWCSKFQFSLLDVNFRLIAFQSSLLLFYLRNGPNRCSHCTKVWHETYPKYDAPLSRSTKSGIAPPRPFLCVNRSPIRYDFRGGANVISLRKHPFLLALRRCGHFAVNVLRETSPAAKSEEKRMFTQAKTLSGIAWT